MISDALFESCVQRAGLAPSLHNCQPARWLRDGDVLSLFCDTNIGVQVADSDGFFAALSCGAVLEGMVLALSAHSVGVRVSYTGHSAAPGQGLVALAHLTLFKGVEEDKLHAQLEHRFTWRGAFDAAPAQLYGWTRQDTRLVTDQAGKDWIAPLNDAASLRILQNSRFRRELLAWMRLNARHPRAGIDGMDAAALQLTPAQARALPRAFGWMWPLLTLCGKMKGLTSEADVTRDAPVIAIFHRPEDENPVHSGRAYLRLCLEAASLGFAGWPMAALADDPAAKGAVCARFGVPADRRFIQAIRFGTPAAMAEGGLYTPRNGRAGPFPK